MARSHQQWRHGSQLLLLAAALALLLLIAAGSADAKCVAGYADCDHKSYNGCETNVYNDPHNCKYCGYVCKTYPHAVTKCEYGECKWMCNYLYGDCDHNIKNGCETYLGSDPYNCKYCGNVCKLSPYYKNGEAVCSGGVCISRCKKGWKYDSYKKYCYK